MKRIVKCMPDNFATKKAQNKEKLYRHCFSGKPGGTEIKWETSASSLC
jgi:hypothetical protein